MTAHPFRSGPRERLRRLVARLYPERQIVLRVDGRLSFIRLSPRKQMAATLVVLAAGAWTAYASVGYVFHDAIVASKDRQIEGIRLAYRSLLGEMGEYQKRFAAISQDLVKNHGLMLSLVEENAALQQSLKDAENKLTDTRAERKRVAAARARLKHQLGEVEGKMRSLANRNFSLKDDLQVVEADLERAMNERNEAVSEGQRMRQRIVRLEARLADLQKRERETVHRLTDQAVAHIENVEKVIAMTGLNADALITAATGREIGRGGPFVAAKEGRPAGGHLMAELSTLDSRLDHWQALQDVMRRLPLAAPLDGYYVTSSFGKRRDPINKKWAMHYGLDLGSTKKASVYVTAPGRVTFAGWKGKYGRMVEVDHGAGVKTRYGHLRKFTVKKGQAVKFRDKIGVLGNSGRSTGEHLHYEIQFKGKPRNPMKFIRAGHYVFKE